ncbi:unnamed protein product [Prorocentrum cordatum]|uniref:DNA2/NAM7 helicase-like C-terminal domain-containing protein n=1 Tax=Prorocentrum cordatum TaxID=2364126 RepID=A0ABN9S0M8_9DINO|nr:unnamed protein product [Polarella glacialis]
MPGFPWPNPDCRVCFVDTSGAGSVEDKSGFSWFNAIEAKIAVDVLEGLFKAGMNPDDVCVLTPYVAQRRAILGELTNRKWRGSVLSSVTVDTIDGYQGMEKDLVIFSATRSNVKRELGFVADARRMNVMLTRARRGVIVVGDSATLGNCTSADSKWSDWIEWVEGKESVVRCAQGSLRLPRPGTTKAHGGGVAPARPAAGDRPRRPAEPAAPVAGQSERGVRREACSPAGLELAPGWGSAVDPATGRTYYRMPRARPAGASRRRRPPPRDRTRVIPRCHTPEGRPASWVGEQILRPVGHTSSTRPRGGPRGRCHR